MLIERLIALLLDMENHMKRWREKQEASAHDVQIEAPVERNQTKAEPIQDVIFYWSRRLGGGVVHGYAEALQWCRKAAEQGYPLAQIDLGRAYERGEGVPSDLATAKRWYRSAAELGCVDGLGALIGLCKKLGTYSE
jgi:TPR repeat protein